VKGDGVRRGEEEKEEGELGGVFARRGSSGEEGRMVSLLEVDMESDVSSSMVGFKFRKPRVWSSRLFYRRLEVLKAMSLVVSKLYCHRWEVMERVSVILRCLSFLHIGIVNTGLQRFVRDQRPCPLYRWKPGARRSGY